MPQAILKFMLPEEHIEFMRANRAGDVLLALDEFKNWLRSEYKHNSDNYTDDQYAVLENIREQFYAMCGEVMYE